MIDKKQLYLALKDVLQHIKKISKEIESIEKFKNFRFPSLIDIHMSCNLCLGDLIHK